MKNFLNTDYLQFNILCFLFLYALPFFMDGETQERLGKLYMITKLIR